MESRTAFIVSGYEHASLVLKAHAAKRVRWSDLSRLSHAREWLITCGQAGMCKNENAREGMLDE